MSRSSFDEEMANTVRWVLKGLQRLKNGGIRLFTHAFTPALVLSLVEGTCPEQGRRNLP
jgi:hypothetical protein